MKKYIPYIVIAVLLFLIFQKDEPKIITKTKIEYVKRTDTITRVEIQEKPVTRYVQRTKTIKGRDSIIYLGKADSTTIQANEYKTELKSNNAVAKLKILTSGELLDVSGVIEYKEKVTTLETIKLRNSSGLFLYGQGSVGNRQLSDFAVGLDYVFKNKIIIGTSGSYNNISQTINFNVKLGIRIF